MTLTPNYASGFGAVKAVFGTQPAPTYGSGACADGCAVDFGPVVAGSDYLYKYAAHLQVTSNDPNGFNLYGEGAADFTDGGANSMTLAQSLYYVASTSGSPADTNTGFTPGFPFNVTTGSVNPSSPSFGTAPTITYGSYPAPIYTASTADGDIYQDYELKVPANANPSNYYVWIVYTVVPR